MPLQQYFFKSRIFTLCRIEIICVKLMAHHPSFSHQTSPNVRHQHAGQIPDHATQHRFFPDLLVKFSKLPVLCLRLPFCHLTRFRFGTCQNIRTKAVLHLGSYGCDSFFLIRSDTHIYHLLFFSHLPAFKQPIFQIICLIFVYSDLFFFLHFTFPYFGEFLISVYHKDSVDFPLPACPTAAKISSPSFNFD